MTLAIDVKQFLHKVIPGRWAYRRLWFFLHSQSGRRDAWTDADDRLSSPPDPEAADPRWRDPFATLRKKWSEVPTDVERVHVPQLLEMGDQELLRFWEETRANAVTGEYFSRRGWYHLLYEPLLRGARMIDFGSGLGMDSLSFASFAAEVSCVDIVSQNLALLKRIAGLKGLHNVRFVYIENFDSFDALSDSYDVILASGSLHNAPQAVTRHEIQALAPRLKIGGRWLQLIYPRIRWEREGRMPFTEWGNATDGKGTPWCEWYDLEKLMTMFEPMKFEPVLAFNYHNDDFNWFDLVRRS